MGRFAGYNWNADSRLSPEFHASHAKAGHALGFQSLGRLVIGLQVSMEQIQQQHHIDDVGRILLQTQEQIRLLREQLTAAATAAAASASMRHASSNHPGGPADVQAFQQILQDAEDELHAKVELVLHGIVNTSTRQTAAAAHSILPAVSVSPKSSDSSSRSGNQRHGSSGNNNVDELDLNYFRTVRSKLSSSAGVVAMTTS